LLGAPCGRFIVIMKLLVRIMTSGMPSSARRCFLKLFNSTKILFRWKKQFGDWKVFWARDLFYDPDLDSLPYSFTKQNPVIILGYLNLGNVFPVTEDISKKLLWAPLKARYIPILLLLI